MRWALWFGACTLFGVIDAVQSYALVQLLHPPDRLTFWQCLAMGLAIGYGLGLMAPPLVWLARRWPLEQQRWRGRLTLLLAVSVALAVLKVILDCPVEYLIRSDCSPLKKLSALDLFQVYFNARFLFYLPVLWLILGVSLALEYYRKFRERELRASHLEAQLSRAQLQVLKMQLQPHFLFNTLNAISALMHQDLDLADRMIARLGELLRSTLENAGNQEVTLRQELAFIEPYLEIEKARLGPRLTVEVTVDPTLMDAQVPNLLLQPLVENAIRHGIAPRAGPGRIEIRAERERDLLQLTIRDNGKGLSSNYKEGVGLANTRARLHQLYGQAQLRMENHPEGGLTVTVALPFRDEPAEPAPEASREDTGGNARPDRR
ncbi:MAG: histidine kinase [Gemmataceae bacterium]|nr:histidine kinase [Gemmataceae bacterium]